MSTRWFELGPVAVGLALAVVGCGSAGGPGKSGPVAGDPSAPPNAIYSAGPFTIAPGQETVMCTYVRGTNDAAEDVTVFHAAQSPGAHHLIVYTVDHPVDLPPSPCSQGGQPGWSQVLVLQNEKLAEAFPAGVGFRIAPHQQYVLETHVINTSPMPLPVTSSFGTTYGEPGSVQVHAATYFFGTMNLDIAPAADAHVEARCQPPVAMRLQTMFGHEHRFGSGVGVNVVRGGASENVYHSTDWEHPPLARFDGGLDLATGDSIRVGCDYHNTGADRLRYPQEMCFAIGYYWPADAGLICVSGGRKDDCKCQNQGALGTGPGGSKVAVTVKRAAAISGVAGTMGEGAPIYCALFLSEDWGGLLPKPGAQPRYFRDAVHQPLASASDAIELTFNDVTPGDYKVSCMMDTIGGGWIPGSGDPVALSAPGIHAVAGESAKTQVTLDFAMP